MHNLSMQRASAVASRIASAICSVLIFAMFLLCLAMSLTGCVTFSEKCTMDGKPVPCSSLPPNFGTETTK